MRGAEITPEFMDALQSDPMVIVYLGSPKLGWNPNVMYELGLRGDAPCVLIRDMKSDGTSYDLPFDIQDKRAFEIPEEKETEPAPRVRAIRDLILTPPPPPWTYLYPSATIDLKVGATNGGSRFIDASKQLEKLFGLKAIRGKALDYVIDHLLEMMPKCQRQPFLNEQSNLIGRLVVVFGPPVQNIHATIPIVFEKHEEYAGRAFLPIIQRYQLNKVTNVLRLRVLYLDVTSVTKAEKSHGYYTCSLTGNELINLKTPVIGQ